jgi:hypothetical protein
VVVVVRRVSRAAVVVGTSVVVGRAVVVVVRYGAVVVGRVEGGTVDLVGVAVVVGPSVGRVVVVRSGRSPAGRAVGGGRSAVVNGDARPTVVVDVVAWGSLPSWVDTPSTPPDAHR